ncbi:hypothetical protein CO726_17295 [Bacillus fungorum]|uniref:Uncharacterized protein n=1 Tax=Bacillus fungorum TaxID=2039284 RepID=A0A2G6QAX8_9BACI|nr:arylamine N-acetyltransferase [Bacillus fungorum]PIE93968.1 hypothetical protein CO726_17295 [Bacillus fungorum]
MTDYQKQFFTRVNIEEKETVSFEYLPHIMQAMAQTVPFENLNILENNFTEISKENLKEKIIVEHEGSPFNKVPLIVKLTEDGHASLTKDTLTIAKNGKKTKENVTDVQYKNLLHSKFGITL